jgi:hypothetical protein
MTLAFNVNGEPFALPQSASGWRVRRMKAKGTAELIYGSDGVPLVLALDADIEDLRREVRGMPGRYRLDPVDEERRSLVEVPAAYVFVHPEMRAFGDVAIERVVIEAMRVNTELARSVVEHVAFVRGVQPGEKPMAEAIAEAFSAIATATAITDSAVERQAHGVGVEPMVPPMDAVTLAHFLGVRSHLTPAEARLASEIVKELSPPELVALFDMLRTLSVPDAVARVRVLLGTRETKVAS